MIYFCAHDITRPSGGVAVLYEHVEILRRHGYDARILHIQPGFAPKWLSVNVPICYAQGDFRPQPDDIIVIPEDFAQAIQWFSKVKCRRIIFCQNQFYAASVLASMGDWRNYGVETVLASSVTVRDFLALSGWPGAPLIPYAIDGDRYRPAQKMLQISYMPRKRGLDATMIRTMFPHRFPEYADVPWRPLDGLHRDQVAAEFGRSAIFLSLAQNESMGLPALEAMSADTLVAGFHGDGDLGLSAARDAALWIDSLDEALTALGTMVRWLRQGDPAAQQQSAAGRRLARSYSAAVRDTALLAAWRNIIAGRS